jgi:pimeloyl-ACP methyl ester carboxylesterase
LTRPDARQRWEGDDAPPSRGYWAEIAWNFARMVGTFRKRGPRGPVDGQPVLVIPGFLCGDQATFSLRRELARAGFRVHGWKQGFNLGVKPDTLEKIGERIDSLQYDRPIVIVGWSLGGLFGREYARYHPDRVKAVITLGSPFSGDPRQNNVWPLYERIAGHRVDQPPLPRITEKPPVPHLALWSRRDGLIAPRAARGLEHERDKEVELDCHHMAFGISKRAAREVVREVKRFLEEQA